MVTIETCWENYTASKTLQPSTVRNDKNRYTRHILSYWHKTNMETLKFQDVIIYRKHLFDQKLCPQSVKLCLALLYGILRRAIQLEIYSAQLPYFEMPKIDNRRMRHLSEHEAQQLLSALESKSELWHDISLFALNTGMRAGEIFSLTKSSINLTQKNITIYRCKNTYARIISLNQITINIVEKHSQRQSAYLFCEPSSPDKIIPEVSSIFRKTVEIIGLNDNITNAREKIVFHSLRHTFASWLVQRGTPILGVGNLLGHKSLQMTMRYSHLTPDQDRTAVDIIPNVLFPHTYLLN